MGGKQLKVDYLIWITSWYLKKRKTNMCCHLHAQIQEVTAFHTWTLNHL